jgi:hypothetical protein
MRQEELHGSQIARPLVNLSRLCSAHRVRAVRRTIATGALNPSMDDARVSACREVRLLPEAAREQVLIPSATDAGQSISDSALGLRDDLEVNRSARLLLHHRRSIPELSRLRFWRWI